MISNIIIPWRPLEPASFCFIFTLQLHLRFGDGCGGRSELSGWEEVETLDNGK